MIRLFIIILSSLFIFRPAIYSQDTSSLEWAPEGATWHYNFFSVSSETVSSLKMTVAKDTVVNGKDARIIDGEIYLYNGDTAVATDYYEQGRIVIHQQGDSIFYLRENKFEILYDFSMEEGDTMRIVTPAPYDPETSSVQDTFIYVTLESTGTIEINGEILRTQKLKNFFPGDHSTRYEIGEVVIEKIGSSRFFLPYNDLLCDGACPIPLRCYQDDKLFYKRVDIACDSTYVISSTDPGSGNKEIKLYPNPVLKGETLQIEGMDVKEWILRNIQGKVISKGTSFIGSATINLSDNAVAGMYFMELRSGKYSYVKNLIIQ